MVEHHSSRITILVYSGSFVRSCNITATISFPHRSGLKKQKLNNRYRYRERYRSLNKFDPMYSF